MKNLGITWEELKTSKPQPAPNTNNTDDYQIPDQIFSAAKNTMNIDVDSNTWYTAQLAKWVAKTAHKTEHQGAGFDNKNIERQSGDKKLMYRSTMGAVGLGNSLAYGAPMMADTVYASPEEIEATLMSLGIMSGTKYRYGYTLGSEGNPWYITIKPFGKMCVGASAGVAEEFVTVPDPFIQARIAGTPYAVNYLKPLPTVDIFPNSTKLPILPTQNSLPDINLQNHDSWPVGGSVALSNNRINYGVYAPATSIEMSFMKGLSENLNIISGLNYKFPIGQQYTMGMKINFIDDMYHSLQTYLLDYMKRTVSVNRMGVVPWQHLLWEIDIVILREGPAIDKCLRLIALIDSDSLEYELKPSFHRDSAATETVNFTIVGTQPTLWDKAAAFGDNPSLLLSTMDKNKPITLGDFRLGDPNID